MVLSWSESCSIGLKGKGIRLDARQTNGRSLSLSWVVVIEEVFGSHDVRQIAQHVDGMLLHSRPASVIILHTQIEHMGTHRQTVKRQRIGRRLVLRRRDGRSLSKARIGVKEVLDTYGIGRLRTGHKDG